MKDEPKNLQPLFIWMKDRSAMRAFARAFARKLRDDGLNVVLDSPQTDPHQRYALAGSCEVYLPSGHGKREPEELAMVSVYRDGDGEQAKLVLKIDPASASAFESISPALAHATLAVPHNDIILRDGAFDFNDL